MLDAHTKQRIINEIHRRRSLLGDRLARLRQAELDAQLAKQAKLDARAARKAAKTATRATRTTQRKPRTSTSVMDQALLLAVQKLQAEIAQKGPKA